MTGLTHLDDDGRARMVDVGDKATTKRVATATATFTTRPDVIALVQADGLPKADVIATARIAGIAGAKRTSELIPLCHQLALSSVSLDFAFTRDSIVITATAKTTGQTGVEMEALTAASIAGLTLHDMVKAVDPASVLGDIRLLEKSGGKRGNWTPEGPGPIEPTVARTVRPRTAAVIVASTAGAAGTREDLTGPRISAWLSEHDYAVDAVTVVSDADVHLAITAALDAAPAVLITTGGTGLSPSDRTPEATQPHLDRELPGIAEAIRTLGSTKTPTAALSRGLAGVSGGTVVVNLPGSTGGVKDGLAVLDGLLDHLVAQIAGGGAHE
ncbi:cyclic pyranopterin monophosphate synthase subunit MoaC [Plantibacter flavus]|uniref:Cyclic pyranopterin monophosphate synthase n=1 Tax=Plantibacter flavus TaxID=150123 RepID=A0A3N2C7T9_9MICO|nr:bifunctional molybdenum cofactor biosynthesis protein MoaC/MoaB [Plantibacter flavus]ROR83576.1 cyclic pyranopterin monophosphate synthase subunit MoaC [Plantibacter flavus]SMG25043.1 cyclic pyranopterin monophosphate synthase subunit MoaC [Plantibacter flavus]